MPFEAGRLMFWPGGIDTLTTVRAIAGAAGGVCAAATTVRPATPNSAVAVAKRIASSENRNGLTDISQVATGSPPREEVTLRSRRLARIRSPGSPSKPFQLLDDCQKGRGKAGLSAAADLDGRSNGAVSKRVVPLYGTEGSNPSPSA